MAHDGTAAPANWTGSSFFGLYPAIVTDIVDTDRLSRVQVSFPWLGDDGDRVRAWATLLTPYADDDQGFVALPEVGTQVVVGFEAGDLHRPYVVGLVLERPGDDAGHADPAQRQATDQDPVRKPPGVRRHRRAPPR